MAKLMKPACLPPSPAAGHGKIRAPRRAAAAARAARNAPLAMQGLHLIGRWPEPAPAAGRARRRAGSPARSWAGDFALAPGHHPTWIVPGCRAAPSAPIWLGRSMEQIRRGRSD
jgi:hypothetical protein